MPFFSTLLTSLGFEVVLSEESTRDTYYKGQQYALVFGNEVDGVAQEVVDAADGAIEIPQAGTKHSVNVSVAGGVVLWNFFWQVRPKR